MRRLALILALVAAAAGTVVASAAGDDARTYSVELDNAFGLVEGSDVKVAGVVSGAIKGLDINDAKRAVVEIEVTGPLSQFTDKATCSSEPQSLIAEYFLDCEPGQGSAVDGDGSFTVPVEQTEATVQNDLVNNTLREPFKRMLQLIINEFGTALAGNPENLNAAIRRGAPALRETQKVLEVLGRQSKIIRDLNVNSDEVIGRLADNRDDVVKFVEEARDTSQASAARRVELAEGFRLLPTFLAELRPTLDKLGDLADQQIPFLRDLRASTPQLNRLSEVLPPFNDASQVSLDHLGEGAKIGRRALIKARDEIRAADNASQNAFVTADSVATLLEDLDDPRRIVEVDNRAASPATPRPAPTGYTGLEGLLNYVYYQTGAINQFDQIGHLLHFTLNEIQTGACHEHNSEQEVPARAGGHTHLASEKANCVAWLGENQPQINQTINLQPYPASVCPSETDGPDPGTGADDVHSGSGGAFGRPEIICDAGPAGPSSRGAATRNSGPSPEERQELLELLEGGDLPGLLEDVQKGDAELPKALAELLGVAEGAKSKLPDVEGSAGDLLGGATGGGGLGGNDRSTANDLLNFLFGN
jgi:phospholipid/cholesterol/gamma-HCH transport system substrate-binding protein